MPYMAPDDTGYASTLLWTCTSKHDDFRRDVGLCLPGERDKLPFESKELCTMINSVLRDDALLPMPALASLVCGIRKQFKKPRDQLPAITYRGGGFDRSLRTFWTLGKTYRVPVRAPWSL